MKWAPSVRPIQSPNKGLGIGEMIYDLFWFIENVYLEYGNKEEDLF